MNSNDKSIFLVVLAIVVMCVIFWVSSDVSDCVEQQNWIDSGHRQIQYTKSDGFVVLDWIYIDPNDKCKE